MTKKLFVTVGTTLFEDLIEATTSLIALEWMFQNGYTHLIVQYGKGQEPNNNVIKQYQDRIHIELYRFKSSLLPDMVQADTIICHAGAGTVMEALRLQKLRLIVVINSKLMDNHQTELADAMGTRHHLYVVRSPKDLIETTKIWDEMETFQAKLYNGGDEYDVPRILNNFFGLNTKEE